MIPADFIPDIDEHIELMRKIIVEVREDVLNYTENQHGRQMIMDHCGSLMVHFHEMLYRVAGDVLHQARNAEGESLPNKDQLRDMIPGMSLRDYFAGHALIAVSQSGYNYYDKCTQHCYQIADAMLKARRS